MGPEDGIRMMAPPRLALNAAQWVSVGRDCGKPLVGKRSARSAPL